MHSKYSDSISRPVTLLAVMLGLIGCGRSVRVVVYPVEGKVLFNGQPAAGAMVAFHPLGESEALVIRPVATTDADGAFRLTTYVAGDGAPAGDYTVTVIWPDRSLPLDECEGVVAHDRYNGRYADPAMSPWKVHVRPGDNVVPLFTMGSWSTPRKRNFETGKS